LKGGAKPPLPVDPQRLQAAFPELTPEDLEAYGEVTKRLLEAGRERGALLRSLVLLGGKAEEQGAASGEELLALRYFRAVRKMQGPSRR
jgi:hypothetical protein